MPAGDYGRDFHATYSGSGIHRLLAGCHGSVRLARTVPEPPANDYQAEGTAAHAELERCLQLNAEPAVFADSLRHVLDYVASLPAQRVVMAERRVLFPQQLVPAHECSGTLDCLVVALDDDGVRHAWVIDYKHGAGEFVIAEENAQLMFYAWAALWNMSVERITLVVIQPNHWASAPPVREYETDKLELFDFATRVVAAIEGAERLHAPLVAGEHCQFCPAAPVCTTRERTALAVITDGKAENIREFVPDLPKPDALDAARLGAVVVHAGAIRKWLKSVEDYAEARALAGEIEVPGCKIVEAPARRAWSDAPHTATRLAALAMPALEHRETALDRVMPRKLIGITEAEKLVVDAYTAGLTDKKAKAEAKAKALEEFSKLTVKESSGSRSLVPLSDPRPPVNVAAKLFAGGINIIEEPQ